MKLPSPIVFSNSFYKNHRESINDNFDSLMEVIITLTISNNLFINGNGDFSDKKYIFITRFCTLIGCIIF